MLDMISVWPAKFGEMSMERVQSSAVSSSLIDKKMSIK